MDWLSKDPVRLGGFSFNLGAGRPAQGGEGAQHCQQQVAHPPSPRQWQDASTSGRSAAPTRVHMHPLASITDIFNPRKPKASPPEPTKSQAAAFASGEAERILISEVRVVLQGRS
jgi:hypothetical protein